MMIEHDYDSSLKSTCLFRKRKFLVKVDGQSLAMRRSLVDAPGRDGIPIHRDAQDRGGRAVLHCKRVRGGSSRIHGLRAC